MSLEPSADVDSGEGGVEGSGIIRRGQVPTGVGVKLVHGAKPGPEIAGGNGRGTNGVDDVGDEESDEDGGEDVLRMGPDGDGPGLYSSDGCVLGIAAANRGEAEALLEGSGLSVRDAAEIAALYDEILDIDDGESDDSDDNNPLLREDLLDHPEVIDVISDGNAGDKGFLRGVGMLDETKPVDIRSSRGGLFAGFAGSADDIADLFDQQVERVLAMQDGTRLGTDV